MKKNPTPIYKSPLFILATSGLFFVSDQILKYLAHHNQDYSYFLIDNYLGWEYFSNPGIAFSIGIPIWLVIIISPVVLLLLLAFVYTKNSSVKRIIGLSLILWAALSNLADRIMFGYTIDYIRAYTAVFNLADIMIIVGALLIIIDEHNKSRRPQK